ncbi:MAG: EamA family transporter [Candidatus Tectomicrobia bacterium]|nr:EamA family transporter [Candidatus Tectomicrobia bacterium]
MLGCYILHAESFSLMNLLEPIRSMKGIASRFAISTALVISLYSVNDKVGLRYMDPFYYLWTSSLIRIVMMVPYMLITPGLRVIREEWRVNAREVMISGALIFFAYFLVLIAMKTGKISYIVSVRQTSIIFGVLLGIIVLKEPYGTIRLTASLVITIGIVLIGLA